MTTASLLRAVERFLLPNACVACDRPVEPHQPDRLLCGVCRSRLRPLVGGCDRCGQPLPPLGPCRLCLTWPAALRWVRSAYWLNDPARAAIHRLKYDGFHALGDELADLTVRRVSVPGTAFLVPIPLSPRRARARGYNQAAALARGLASRWRRPVSETLLQRVRESGTQTALTPAARIANVASAFEACPPPGTRRHLAVGRGVTDGPAVGRREGRAVILVDDVLTTGATLSAAARALADAGWTTVGAVTFARALPYDIRAGG